jgi:glucose/arabinose dehydrogenase
MIQATLNLLMGWRRVRCLPSGLFAFCLSLLAGAEALAAQTYKTEPAFGGLSFNEPTQVVFAPGETTRVFVLERAGRVMVVPDLSVPSRSVFLDLTTRVGNSGFDHGLLSLAFHPRFAENGFFYLWYSTFVDGVRSNRLARFKISATDRTGRISLRKPR